MFLFANRNISIRNASSVNSSITIDMTFLINKRASDLLLQGICLGKTIAFREWERKKGPRLPSSPWKNIKITHNRVVLLASLAGTAKVLWLNPSSGTEQRKKQTAKQSLTCKTYVNEKPIDSKNNPLSAIE